MKTMRFKTGDIIYCPERKLYGEVIQVTVQTICIKTHFTILVQFPESRVSFPIENQMNLEKHNSYLKENVMIAFANYCIAEGFTSYATKRDLVTFLNRKNNDRTTKN